jgi:hypothetical protein
MPIEIRELVIRAAVAPAENKKGKSKGGIKGLGTASIVQDSLKEVSEMMRKQKER